MKKVLCGTFWVHSLSFVSSFLDKIFHIIDKHQDPKMHMNDHKIQDKGVKKCIYLYHFM